MNAAHAGRFALITVSLLAINGCRNDEPHPTDGSGGRAPELFASTGIGPGGTWHYAKPGGITSGPGADSTTGAWDLQHAMKGAPDPSLGGNQLLPGDTVWLLGGEYRNPGGPPGGGPPDTWKVVVAGTSGHPIVFRQKRGSTVAAVLKRDAVFVAHLTSTPTLTVTSQAPYTEFWDFEIAHTNMTRTAPQSGWELPGPVWNIADYAKFVNLIIHDGGVGLLNDGSATADPAPRGVVISGNIIYNNGWDDTDRGHGHGLYLKNNFDPLLVADNIIFNQFGFGIHIYTDGDQGDNLDNIQAKGNISFNNGTLALGYPTPHGAYANLGFLGGKTGNNLLFERNMLFFSSAIPAPYNLVYRDLANGQFGTTNSNRNRNYVVGGNQRVEGGGDDNVGADGWSIVAPDSTSALAWAGQNTTIIRRTAADPNRVNIVVYHGAGASPTPSINLGTLPDGSTFLSAGDSFIVSNVLDFRNTVAHGHYSTSIPLTLSAVPPPTPSGTGVGPTPGPDFNVFVATRVPPPPPPPLSVLITGHFNVKPNVTCEWNAAVTGGNGTNTYTWKKNGATVGTGSFLDMNTGTSSFTLRLDVVSGGQSASDTKSVTVSSGASVCPF